MVYYPDGMVQSINTAVIWLYVLAAILIITMISTIIVVFKPDAFDWFINFFKKIFGVKKVVKTVYSDKSKNYSETEFLPVPNKAPTESFSYEFLGWNKFAKDKKGNFVTEPIFLKKVKTCIVNVYDEKGNILETHEVQYGAGVNINHKLVLKEATNEFEYEFIGWDKETNAFFENTEIHPLFKAKPKKYNYKFVMDDEKTIVFERTSISGTPIICPTDPAKIDDKFIYEFNGWKNYKRNMVLDKDYVFVANFEKREPVNQAEKEMKQKKAIEVVLNDYKKKKKKSDSDEYKLQDSQNFKSSSKIEIEKIEKKELENKLGNKSIEEKPKSLLKGVVVEKNKAKK